MRFPHAFLRTPFLCPHRGDQPHATRSGWRLRPWLVVSLSGVLSITACTTGTSPNAASSTPPATVDAGVRYDNEIPTDPVSGLLGKKVGMVVVSNKVLIAQGWISSFETAAEYYGMQLEVRDANFDAEALVSAAQSFVDQGVDILVIHNNDLTSSDTVIKDAQAKGIYVVGIGQISRAKPDAYIGGEYRTVSARIAEDLATACEGKKVSIVYGDPGGGSTIEEMAGLDPVLKAHPTLNVVSKQSAANYSATAAHDITAAVLRQHPDLCGVYGFWDPMTAGAAQAIDEAGLKGRVQVFTLDSSSIACNGIRTGDMTAAYSYGGAYQGPQAVGMAVWLLQSGIKPGTTSAAVWGTLTKITADNITQPEIASLCYGA